MKMSASRAGVWCVAGAMVMATGCGGGSSDSDPSPSPNPSPFGSILKIAGLWISSSTSRTAIVLSSGDVIYGGFTQERTLQLVDGSDYSATADTYRFGAANYYSNLSLIHI